MDVYKNSKIYKIINTKDDKIYIGSTVQMLYKRMDNHRTNCKDLNRNSKLYQHMRTIGVEYFRIVLIKNFHCSNKEELEGEEFKEISTYETNIILNEDIVYKQKSKEHSKKVGLASRGEKSGNWKYGSVFKREGKSSDGYDIVCWCFSYYQQKEDKPNSRRQKRFQFSIKKYGEEEAKSKAIEKRKQTFPEAPDLENINIIM